jgi:hypothetical protein
VTVLRFEITAGGEVMATFGAGEYAKAVAYRDAVHGRVGWTVRKDPDLGEVTEGGLCPPPNPLT